MTAPDQTNAEVSDEQLREPVFWISSKQMPTPVQGGYVAARAAPEGNFDTPLYTDINRRSVTSQASEGEVVTRDQIKAAIRKGLTDNLENLESLERFDVDVLLRGCQHAMHSRGYEKPTEAADALAGGAADAVIALYAPPVSKRVERLETALSDVIAERGRQKSAEGWTEAHDDQHMRGEMALAAACYAVAEFPSEAAGIAVRELWPWDTEWWKPKGFRRNLVRAAALIIAEIERLDRIIARRPELADPPPPPSHPPPVEVTDEMVERVSVPYDGFTGDVIGSYTTREGKHGVVVQQDGTRVVHVYGRSRVEAALRSTP